MPDNSCTTGQMSPAPKDFSPDPSPEPLWEFIPVTDYIIPKLPVRSGATHLWESFRQLFRRSRDPEPTFLSKPENLSVLTPEQIARLFPVPDWSKAVDALDTTLRDWISRTDPAPRPCFVIGQPFSGHQEIVTRWADRHGAACIQAPTCEQILRGESDWLTDLSGLGPLSVLPDLEHWFLRHANGLNLARRLWEILEKGISGKFVIGCDSWAWAYLNRVWAIPHIEALTLQSFDGTRLQRFISEILQSVSRDRIRFRHVSTGNEIWCVPADTDQPSDEMVRLAAYCRGNPMTALCHWRQRLVSVPEKNSLTSAGETSDVWTDKPGEISLWISDIPPEPVWPEGAEEEAMLLLHALLVHGGLPEFLLPELLPISRTRCNTLLLRLRRSHIVGFQNGRWVVQNLCYPAVRNRLRSKEYLVDDF